VNVLSVSLQLSIQVLHARGWSRRRIARELGIHRKTVAGYLGGPKWPISTTGSEQAEPAKVAIPTAGSGGAPEPKPAISTTGSATAGRVSLCREFLPVITAAMTSGLSATRIHQDLVRDHGFTGSYESVKRCVRALAPRLELPFRRMECAPGEEMQVDFGQGAWIQADGKRRRPHLFRAVLGHSRKGYSEVVWRQDTETFIRCCENAFRHFGGVTRTTVVDNLKAAVLDADWFDPALNPKMAEFARHYGTTVLPTQPGRPEHKGKIEAGIKFAQNNALKGRTFTSLGDQNLFLADWERRVADTRIHGTVRQQVGALFSTERSALGPLPESLFPSFTEARRRVHRDGHVEFERAYYSVPPEYLGRDVWVRGESRVVRLLNHRQELIAAHARAEPGRFVTAETHLHAHKRSGVERGAQFWLGRCRLIGPHTTRWAEGLFAQRGLYGLRALQGLVSLTKDHSADALELAAGTATRRGAYRLRDLRRLLTDGDTVVQVDFLDTHPLIRPLSDYRLEALFPP
jgi:transposase